MSDKNQAPENQDKIDRIVAAAQVHFGRYGMQKATMKEIASELKISKALLYYYFPDKEHLYKAVVEKEHLEFIKNLINSLVLINGAENKLLEFVNIRLQYFRSLINLSRFRTEDWTGMKRLMEGVWKRCRGKEIEVISGVLLEGKEAGLFQIDDVESLSQLFLDLIKGLFQMTIKGKQIFYLEQDEYEALKERTNVFAKIFIRGLKCL